MKINRLEIKNFRGIDHLEIYFHKQINIIIGNNGAGKSAILDSLAIMLSRFIAKIQSSEGTGRFFTEDDISNGESETQNTISLSCYEKEVEWCISKTRRGRKKQTNSNLEQMKAVVKEIYDKLESKSNINLPLAVYYPVNRAVLDIPLRIKKRHTFEQLAAYDQVLTGRRNDFRIFFEWFREREDLEHEMRLDDQDYRDRQLESVRKATESLLPGYTQLRVRRSPLRMTAQKNNEELIINQLSDGEKCLLALTGDLARRLAIANASYDNPLEGSAVVLIDEVDLHLHPAWQRRIVPSLAQTFPNCQFILTTHSPQILSHVSSENIFRLKREKGGVSILQPEAAYGLDSNRILEDIMDVPERPANIKNELSELFLLIHEGKLNEAKRITDDLIKKIGEDPELIKAGTILRRKEIIGK